MNGMSSRTGTTRILLASTLMILGMPALATESLAVPMENGPQAKIPEVDEAACRANMRALAVAEALYFAEYGVYADPFSLENSGILPGTANLVCPYDGSAYTFAFRQRSSA